MEFGVSAARARTGTVDGPLKVNVSEFHLLPYAAGVLHKIPSRRAFYVKLSVSYAAGFFLLIGHFPAALFFGREKKRKQRGALKFPAALFYFRAGAPPFLPLSFRKGAPLPSRTIPAKAGISPPVIPAKSLPSRRRGRESKMRALGVWFHIAPKNEKVDMSFLRRQESGHSGVSRSVFRRR